MYGFRDSNADLVAFLAARAVTYDPATGKGYDIEGALVIDNGAVIDNAAYQPGDYVPMQPAPQDENRRPAAKPKIDNTLLLIGGLGLLLLLKGKR